MTTPEPLIRDDNLRLIFAAAEANMLHERMLHIRAGIVLLTIFVLATLAGLTMTAGIDGIGTLAQEAFAVAIWAALIVCALSPLILFIIFIEHRRTRRDMAEHEDLLRRYNRLSEQ